MPYGVFLEGATTLRRKAMPCWDCFHCNEPQYCDIVKERIKRRPFYCIHYKPKEASP